MTLRWREHIRPYHLEEPFDFFVFRPAALAVLNVLYRTPVTPNQVSIFAMFVAFASGYCLSLGTSAGFFAGGAGILVFSVLDCCDGMLARIRKNNGILGEPLDMFVDIVATISFFSGLAIGLARKVEFGHFWYFAILSGLVIMVHAGIYQYFKKKFCYHRDGGDNAISDHLAKFRAHRDEVREKGGHYFDRLLIWLMLTINKSHEIAPGKAIAADPGYVERHRATLPFWALTGGSTHLGILGVTLLLDRLEIFFFFSLGLAQVCLLMAFAAQTAVAKQIRKLA
jgi:phosphatidylglycerophosphate synthase